LVFTDGHEIATVDRAIPSAQEKFGQMLKNSLDVDWEDESDITLHEASERGDEKAVRQLKNGPHVNAKDEFDLTPLHWAANSGHERVAGLLLENGAAIEAGNCYGTALHVAAEQGHAVVARLLLDKGADVNTEDEERKTALEKAAGRRQ
jgi:ankyrin repeat protein